MNNRSDHVTPVPDSEYKSYHQSEIRSLVNHCMELGMTNKEAELFLQIRYDVSPNWTRKVWETLMQESRPGQKRPRPIPTGDDDDSPSPTPIRQSRPYVATLPPYPHPL